MRKADIPNVMEQMEEIVLRANHSGPTGTRASGEYAGFVKALVFDDLILPTVNHKYHYHNRRHLRAILNEPEPEPEPVPMLEIEDIRIEEDGKATAIVHEIGEPTSPDIQEKVEKMEHR